LSCYCDDLLASHKNCHFVRDHSMINHK
jgi:hypothetical protein